MIVKNVVSQFVVFGLLLCSQFEVLLPCRALWAPLVFGSCSQWSGGGNLTRAGVLPWSALASPSRDAHRDVACLLTSAACALLVEHKGGASLVFNARILDLVR